MENKAHAVMAGIFTIALLIAVVLITLWLNRDHAEMVPYEMVTKLSVPGLNPQAAVRYRGLDIGKVDAISFDPTVAGQILVHLSVRPDTPITRSTYGTLGYQGVTGIAYVQLDDDGTNPVKVTSSKEHVARIEMRPSLFDNLQTRGLAILMQTEELTKRFNAMLTPDNQKMIIGAFDNVSSAATEVRKIPQQLQPTLEKLPAITAQTQQALTSLTTLSKSINALSTKLQSPDGAVDKLTATAEQVGVLADKIELQALPLTSDARSAMRSFDRTMDTLREQPQSILFGASHAAPGPGEPGFTAPSAAPLK